MSEPTPPADQEPLPLPSPDADHLTLARWLASLPCNRRGANKTWVVDVLENAQHVRATARRLERDDR